MNAAIEITTKVHVKVTGPADDMRKALDALYEQGWHITNSGPRMADFPRVDTTQYEIHAWRLGDAEDKTMLLLQLRGVLP